MISEQFPVSIKYILLLYSELRRDPVYTELMELSRGRVKLSEENFVGRLLASTSAVTGAELNELVARTLLHLLSRSGNEISVSKLEYLYFLLSNFELELDFEMYRTIFSSRDAIHSLIEKGHNPHKCFLYAVATDVAIMGFSRSITLWRDRILNLVEKNSYLELWSVSPLSSLEGEQIKKKFNCKFLFANIDKKLLAGVVIKHTGKSYNLSLFRALRRMLLPTN
jgi:hypothetical protein